MFDKMDHKTLMTILIGIGAVVALIAAFVMALVMRRKFLRASESGSESPFTLDGVQKMHDKGRISEKEYKTLRSKIIESMQK